MSLNNILLPANLLAGLYAHTLIDGTAIAVPKKIPVDYLGENKAKLLIIVRHTEVPFLPDAELRFLNSILGACRLPVNDVAIVNWNGVDKTKHDVIGQLSPSVILFFDVEPTEAGLYPAPHYTIQEHDSLQYIQSVSLTALAADVQLKSRLWLALKQLFGL